MTILPGMPIEPRDLSILELYEQAEKHRLQWVRLQAEIERRATETPMQLTEDLINEFEVSV